ncbi:MAG TPA: HU family DNA-binding protein [Anaerovoracaceae bacterium]|nr:HU family DNA-binding protein [Anaerovoracaceae bacterium]
MKKIDKKKLVSLIYKRLGGALSKKSIYDAVSVINDSIIESLLDNKTVSVNNFGTFSTYLFHEHEGLNIASGDRQLVKPFRAVKFRAHSNLSALIEQRKDKFRDP